jgi:2'-5' RNA ligase
MLRTFIAISLNEDCRRQLCEVIQTLKTKIDVPVKWSRDDQLHLTLRFLGNISEDQLAQILDTLTVIQTHPPLSIALQRLVTFPPSRPKVIGVGVKLTDSLAALVHHINKALQLIGLEPEDRAWLPHITLGRIVNPSREKLALGEMRLPGEQLIDHITLVKSEPSAEGSHYSDLHQFSLVGSR